MEKLRVTKVNAEGLEFENGYGLYSDHQSDCCEHHWLSFEHITLEDFDGLTFDLSTDKFFKRIEWYGIELIPNLGHSVKVPGYGSNNGYYSDQLDLVVVKDNETISRHDITECQEVSE